MSDEKNKVDAGKAIQMAIAKVRASGLADEHLNALFNGESEISTREAMLVAHIQHLEGKVFVLSSALEEIAALDSDDSKEVAKVTLERVAELRKVKKKDDK